MKIRLLTIVSLVSLLSLLSFSALASYPAYNYTFYHNTTVSNGNNSLGYLVFDKLPYVPAYYSLSNYSSYSMQQYDVITSGLNESIAVTFPNSQQTNLFPGNTLTLDAPGTYSFKAISNSSLNGQIYVAAATNAVVGITLTSSIGTSLTAAANPITLTSQETIVPISLIVDDDLTPQIINASLFLADQNSTKSSNYSFTLAPNIMWRIENDTVANSTVARTGASSSIGSLFIVNTGNIDVDFVTSISGNGSVFITLPNTQTLFRKNRIFYNFMIQVPSSYTLGSYLANISLTAGNMTIYKLITITLSDNLPPAIDNIEFKSDQVAVDNYIRVTAKDNIEVANVTITFDGTEHNTTKDQQYFVLPFNFTRISKYSFTICATDSNNNIFCTSKEKTFSRIKILYNTSSTVVLPSRKYSSIAKVRLFSYNQTIPEGIKVKLSYIKDLDPNASDSFSVRLIDGKGSIRQFDAVNMYQPITEAGDIYLQTINNQTAVYEGLLEVVLPDYAEAVPNINFNGKFLDYDVPENYCRDWFGKQLCCDVVDTGDLDTSYYQCSVEFDIKTNIDDLPIPTTVSERRKLDTELNDTTTAFSHKKLIYNSIITLFVMLLLAVLGYLYFALRVYPYARYKMGKSEEDK